jgi:cytochrome P450
MIDCIPVQAGTMMVLDAVAVNRDPAIWGPSADQWIPERWLRPLPEAVIDAYPPEASSHML